MLNNIQTPIHENMDIENLKIRDHGNIKKKQKWNDYLKLENNIKENYELQNIVSEYVYVYLNKNYKFNNDKKYINKILMDEWFNRAWTLQEYLANDSVYFYNINNDYICNKNDLMEYVKFSNDDKMPSYLFKEYEREIKYKSIPAGTILNWMLIRKSTRLEDKVYSLMGLLNTYITPLYGEGFQNAIMRLLKKHSDNRCDTSVLDWLNINNLLNENNNCINNVIPSEFNNNPYSNQNIIGYNRNNIQYNDFNWLNIGIKINTFIIKVKIINYFLVTQN